MHLVVSVSEILLSLGLISSLIPIQENEGTLFQRKLSKQIQGYKGFTRHCQVLRYKAAQVEGEWLQKHSQQEVSMQT